MKVTYRDIAWFAIVALIVVYLSKCHRDKTDILNSNVLELEKKAKTADSIYNIESQRADNKLAIVMGQMQNATEKQQETEKQLNQSMTTIARLSKAVKAAKGLPLDSSFTLVSPEFIAYCDSLADNAEQTQVDYSGYKKNTGILLLAKDTTIRLQAGIIKKERSAYEQCRRDFMALQQFYSEASKIAKPKNQVYVGAELIGNQQTIIQNVGAVVSLKTKTNKLWQVSGGLQSNGGFYGRINGNILISLKR